MYSFENSQLTAILKIGSAQGTAGMKIAVGWHDENSGRRQPGVPGFLSEI